MTIEHDAFAAMVETHRRELRVHCYRMLGSFDEAEDMVQETFLRAWKGIGGFEGRSGLRAWLYRIATNACLDALDGRARRVLPADLRPPSDPGAALPARTDIPWLQPFPDRLAPDDAEPGAAAVARETIELAFLVAIQHLPPRQRAAVLLRDVLGWRPGEIASALDGSVASVNSALQRARATLREHLPERRVDWAPSTPPTADERTVLRRYMAAMESADPDALAAVLAEDVRTAMPPWPMWFRGRDAMVAALRASWSPDGLGHRFRMLPTRVNGQPAVAAYLRTGEDHRAFAISVLRIEHGLITEAIAFHETHLFAAFGLPLLLTDDVPGAAPSP
ncbi:sigma-70 family RNA polymerase sigma factor [Pseudonocardia adelaidensis]|uniref:Sigma-70 family RNA polymerase sigma factor n=1 Tax=Pseudonocardia adelaidensis TaxID=648754 RepID=A0ABP9P6Y1_9PSEU